MSGRPGVTDGDTLRFGPIRVRLHGIDAPELRQSGGRVARRHLAALIGDGEVACTGRERDRYGRLVAVCFARGVNVNAAMVADGYAVAFIRYSMDYVQQEAEARVAGVGIWGARGVVTPRDFRRVARLVAANDNQPVVRPATAVAPGGVCPVKVSIGGIAHDAGSPWYARTTRFRCYATLADAEAAGARLPRR